MFKQFQGLIAAPYTPMHTDGSINLTAVREQARGLAESGVAGAFICGTTGEGVSLTCAERRSLTEAWVTSGGGLRVIVHVGHNCLEDAQALAAHASQHGAAGVAFMGPTFFRPATVDDLIEVCEPVARAAGKLPFFFYHIPSMTGIRVSMAEFLARAEGRIANLAGIKFTDADLWEFQRCVALEDGRYELLFGGDEILLAAMGVGARGAVGSTYNYAAPLYLRMIAAWEAGDFATAMACSQRAVALVAVLVKYGVLRAGKALMARIGIDCGPVRWPLRPLTPAQVQALYAEVDALGVPGLSTQRV